jgi:uncharacterized membrane protein
MNPNAGVARVPSRERVYELDLLRAVAALQMVQGHTIDAVLSPVYRSGALHHAWLWLRGLTSVAFLFAAGLSFSLATLRDLPRHRADRRNASKRVRRAGTLLLFGYALHAPVGLLFGADMGSAGVVVAQAVIVDVLQCIGVSLLVLEGLAFALPSARAVEFACVALSVLLMLFSPAARHIDPAGTWLPLLDYVTPRGGSLFPLLPWAAHVFAGAASARLLLQRERRVLRLACAALVLIAGAAWLPLAAPVPDHLSRLGWVVAATALLSAIAPAIRTWPAWIGAVSSETLFIYAFHVVLVYGQGLGLSDRVGPVLAPASAAFAALGMIALSFGGALAYRRASAGLARSTATS